MDTFSSMLILFFLVMNPLGNLPVLIAELDRQPPERYRFIVLRECLIALAILLLFVFCGGEILKALRITQASLELAGGIILFMIAIKLVFGSASGSGERSPRRKANPLSCRWRFRCSPVRRRCPPRFWSAAGAVSCTRSKPPGRWPPRGRSARRSC